MSTLHQSHGQRTFAHVAQAREQNVNLYEILLDTTAFIAGIIAGPSLWGYGSPSLEDLVVRMGSLPPCSIESSLYVG